MEFLGRLIHSFKYTRMSEPTPGATRHSTKASTLSQRSFVTNHASRRITWRPSLAVSIVSASPTTDLRLLPPLNPLAIRTQPKVWPTAAAC